MLQIDANLIPFVRLTKNTWTPIKKLEGASIIPLIFGSNMKDLIGSASLEETQEGGTQRVSLLIHADLGEGPWYALPVGSLGSVERNKEKKIVAITTYRLAAIRLSQDAPEGSQAIQSGEG